MARKSILLSLYFCVLVTASAQVFPSNGIKLNQTQVMFECAQEYFAAGYEIQLIEDTGVADFSRPLIKQKDTSSATLIGGLHFGKKYQWRYQAFAGDRPIWKGPFKFEVSSIDSLGRENVVVTILNNDSSKHAGGLIVPDVYSIINRNGQPVWYLPKRKEIYDGLLRDLRLTSAGTITFLSGLPYARAYECDLQGNILWQAPDDGKVSGDTSEFYHHEFQRLLNGNYVIAGNKFVWKKIPDWFIQKANSGNPAEAKRLFEVSPQMAEMNKLVDGALYTKIQFGTIIEYNFKHEVIWKWSSETYFNDKEVFTFAGNDGKMPGIIRDAHLNAFSVDAKKGFLYVSFKEINRLVKIEERSGMVVTEWKGDSISPLSGAFFHQHGASLSANGELLVFDNSKPGQLNSSAQVLALTQPAESVPAKVAFSFPCRFDSTLIKVDKGGNVDELPNKNLLACLGVGLQEVKNGALVMPEHMGRIVELNRNKEIVWHAAINGVMPPYRAHYTSSLYPCYFTFAASPWYFPVKQKGETVAKSFSVVIYNEGSEADSYLVKLRFKKAGIKAQQQVAHVPANSSCNVSIWPSTFPQTDDEIEITVQSNVNPALVRKQQIAYHK